MASRNLVKVYKGNEKKHFIKHMVDENSCYKKESLKSITF